MGDRSWTTRRDAGRGVEALGVVERKFREAEEQPRSWPFFLFLFFGHSMSQGCLQGMKIYFNDFPHSL